jgi:uncharacterized protein YoxC
LNPCTTTFSIQTKAFDKKTSVLHYLVKVVKRNNPGLMDFHKDLTHVGQAKNIAIDSMFTEIRDLKKDIEAVHKTAQKHTDLLSGEESKFTLKRIMQQITPVRSLSGVTHCKSSMALGAWPRLWSLLRLFVFIAHLFNYEQRF